MNVYRYVLQKVIDILWELDRLPLVSQAHQMFYQMLRERYGFRAHVAKQLYKYALSLVKAARRSGGSKPVVRRLSVRLDRYDALVDAENWRVKVNIRGRWYTLKLMHDPMYLAKFQGRKWYEVIVKWECGKLWVVIPFRFDYKPYKPHGVTAVDVNLRDIAVYDGRSIRYLTTWFERALTLKRYAEKTQKAHPRMWRRSRRLLERVRRRHRRARNIVVDRARRLALWLIRRARRHRYAIAVEDLDKLWHTRSRSSSKLAWLLSRFAYRKVFIAIITKAVEYNVPMIIVDPKDTSTTCPRCGERLRVEGRTVVCSRCGFRADRDYTAALNIHNRASTWMRGALGSPDRPAR